MISSIQGVLRMWLWVALPVCLLGVAASQAWADDGVHLSSGALAELQEHLIEQGDDGLVHRFRFVSAGFDPSAGTPEAVMADLTTLCTDYVLPALADTDIRPDLVIISIADHAVEFGVVNPEVRQVFEAFSIRDGTCIWEVF